jgi:hypothetical protein
VEVGQSHRETSLALGLTSSKAKTTKVLATQVHQLKETSITSVAALTWTLRRTFLVAALPSIRWHAVELVEAVVQLKKDKNLNPSAEEF